MIRLFDAVVFSGQEFVLQVDDAQGKLVLSPGSDRLVLQRGLAGGNEVRTTLTARMISVFTARAPIAQVRTHGNEDIAFRAHRRCRGKHGLSRWARRWPGARGTG